MNCSYINYSGETLHGAVYLPSGVKEGEKYPTVLYVYGGPEFQVRVVVFVSLLFLHYCSAMQYISFLGC